MRVNTWIMAAMAVAVFSGGMALGTNSVFAASVSERECEGTYEKNGSESSCTTTSKKDVPGGAFGTETTVTQTGTGNTGNKTEEECTGNVGQCKQQ